MKAKTLSEAAAPTLAGKGHAGPWLTPPWTLEERVQRIETMRQRINGYIQFMCQIANLNGTSAEAKEIAVTAFYERLVIVEKQLGRIHEGFCLE